MGKIELIDTGRLTEKQARLNMEKCAEFLARMIQKYGDVVLGEISVAHRHTVAVHKIYRNHQSAPTRRTTKKTAPKSTFPYAVSIAQKDRQPQKTTGTLDHFPCPRSPGL